MDIENKRKSAIGILFISGAIQLVMGILLFSATVYLYVNVLRDTKYIIAQSASVMEQSADYWAAQRPAMANIADMLNSYGNLFEKLGELPDFVGGEQFGKTTLVCRDLGRIIKDQEGQTAANVALLKEYSRSVRAQQSAVDPLALLAATASLLGIANGIALLALSRLLRMPLAA